MPPRRAPDPPTVRPTSWCGSWTQRDRKKWRWGGATTCGSLDMAFSPDGQYLAVTAIDEQQLGSPQDGVAVWDWQERQLVARLETAQRPLQPGLGRHGHAAGGGHRRARGSGRDLGPVGPRRDGRRRRAGGPSRTADHAGGPRRLARGRRLQPRRSPDRHLRRRRQRPPVGRRHGPRTAGGRPGGHGVELPGRLQPRRSVPRRAGPRQRRSGLRAGPGRMADLAEQRLARGWELEECREYLDLDECPN